MTLLILAQALVATALIAAIRRLVSHRRAIAARRAAALEDFAAGRGLGAFQALARCAEAATPRAAAPVIADTPRPAQHPANPTPAIPADSASRRLYTALACNLGRVFAALAPPDTGRTPVTTGR